MKLTLENGIKSLKYRGHLRVFTLQWAQDIFWDVEINCLKALFYGDESLKLWTDWSPGHVLVNARTERSSSNEFYPRRSPVVWIFVSGQFFSQLVSFLPSFRLSPSVCHRLQDRSFLRRPSPLHPHLEELWRREHSGVLHRPQRGILGGLLGRSGDPPVSSDVFNWVCASWFDAFSFSARLTDMRWPSVTTRRRRTQRITRWTASSHRPTSSPESWRGRRRRGGGGFRGVRWMSKSQRGVQRCVQAARRMGSECWNLEKLWLFPWQHGVKAQ